MVMRQLHVPDRGPTIISLDYARQERIRRELLRKSFVENPITGHYRPERANLRQVVLNTRGDPWQQRLLAFLRDNVDPRIPRAYYKAVLGHDLHISRFAELSYRHFHATEVDPFNVSKLGWWEDVGLASCGKVTTAFRDFIAAQLVTDSTAIGDFKYHEVGTDNTAEANSQTALIATTGIARVAGTQTNPTAPTYQSVATITGDTTETWEEHGLFNASSGSTMMDRSLISPNAPVVASDQVQFTYTLTENAEA